MGKKIIAKMFKYYKELFHLFQLGWQWYEYQACTESYERQCHWYLVMQEERRERETERQRYREKKNYFLVGNRVSSTVRPS